MYATQYRESYPYYQHEKIGYNYRMSNICAGIGRGQSSDKCLCCSWYIVECIKEAIVG